MKDRLLQVLNITCDAQAFIIAAMDDDAAAGFDRRALRLLDGAADVLRRHVKESDGHSEDAARKGLCACQGCRLQPGPAGAPVLLLEPLAADAAPAQPGPAAVCTVRGGPVQR